MAFVNQGWAPGFRFVDSQLPPMHAHANSYFLERGTAERFRVHFAMLLGALSVFTGIPPSELTPDSVRREVFKLAYGRQPGQTE